MANTSTSNKPIVLESTDIVANDHSISHQLKSEVTMALSALDSLYKENISAYADEIHAYSHKIEQLQSRLETLEEKMAPHHAMLEVHQKDIDYTLRLLERLSEEWIQKSLVISALESELSQLEHSTQERQQILKERHERLKHLSFEIEDVELLLLEHELQKQNMLILLEPMEREMRSIKHSIKELESEKRYVESAHLHKLSPSAQALSHTPTETRKLIPTK